jgi:hypothetical protein
MAKRKKQPLLDVSKIIADSVKKDDLIKTLQAEIKDLKDRLARVKSQHSNEVRLNDKYRDVLIDLQKHAKYKASTQLIDHTNRLGGMAVFMYAHLIAENVEFPAKEKIGEFLEKHGYSDGNFSINSLERNSF